MINSKILNKTKSNLFFKTGLYLSKINSILIFTIELVKNFYDNSVKTTFLKSYPKIGQKCFLAIHKLPILRHFVSQHVPIVSNGTYTYMVFFTINLISVRPIQSVCVN